MLGSGKLAIKYKILQKPKSNTLIVYKSSKTFPPPRLPNQKLTLKINLKRRTAGNFAPDNSLPSKK